LPKFFEVTVPILKLVSVSSELVSFALWTIIVLSVYSLSCAMFTSGIIYGKGNVAVAPIFGTPLWAGVRYSDPVDLLEVVFFFESVC